MELIILIVGVLVAAALFFGLRSVAVGVALLAQSVAGVNEAIREGNDAGKRRNLKA